MTIQFPSDTRNIINQMRGAIGRTVTFKLPYYSACTTCGLDPTTNTSLDSQCEECEGLYWIPSYSGVVISGHITHGHSDVINWQSVGEIFDGDVRVQIELEDTTITTLDATEYVVVDDKDYEIKKRILRGVPDLNRVLLDLVERKKDSDG